jgi:hypothetical protein
MSDDQLLMKSMRSTPSTSVTRQPFPNAAYSGYGWNITPTRLLPPGITSWPRSNSLADSEERSGYVTLYSVQ